MLGLDDLATVERLAWEAVEGAPLDVALHSMCDAIGDVTGSTSLIDPGSELRVKPSFVYVDRDLVDLMMSDFATPDTNPFMAALPSMAPGVFHHVSR